MNTPDIPCGDAHELPPWLGWQMWTEARVAQGYEIPDIPHTRALDQKPIEDSIE